MCSDNKRHKLYYCTKTKTTIKVTPYFCFLFANAAIASKL